MSTSDHDKKGMDEDAKVVGHESTHARSFSLGESYGWLRSVVENSSENITVVDLDGTLRYASPAFGRMLGHDPGEAVGTMNMLEHVHPDDLPRVLEETERALAEGGTTSNRAEYRFRHKNGSWRWVESIGTYLPDDPNVGGVVVQTRDVTERKEAEEALRRSEEERLSVLESITDAFFTLDRDWRFVYVNARAQDLFFNAREDILGERIWEDPTFYPHYRRAVEESRTVRFEALYPPSGSWYSVRAYPSDSGLSVYLQDVTERRRAEGRLREAEERYRTLVEQIPAVTYIDRADGSFDGVYTSPQVENLLGYTPEEWREGKLWEKRLHPDDRERILAADEGLEVHGEPFAEEYRLLAKDGSVVWVREEAVLVRDGEGEPLFWQGVISDLTERRNTEEALRESEERFRLTFEAAGIGMALSTPEGRYLQANRSFCELLGYPEGELLGMTFRDITHPDDLGKDLELGHRLLVGESRNFSMEKRYVRKDGSPVWVDLTVSMLRGSSDEPLYAVSQAQDISDRKALEERLRHEALHDPLTGLPNRTLLVDRLGSALARSRRRKRDRVAVLFMDLDDFKVVNDSLGHGIGDELLVGVAHRLARCVRPGDTLARFGGDEFVLLLEGAGGHEEAGRVAGRILDELKGPFVLSGRKVYARADIGIAVGGASTGTPEDLLRDADTAMYRAKEGGSGYSLFDPSMHERAVGRLERENDLRRAVEEGEFVVRYQPIVRLDGGGAWGVEALVRWRHPQRGLLYPGEFIPAAEDSGLVVPMGEGVLEEACRNARRWLDGRPGLPPMIVCVNLSARQLLRPDLAETVEGILASSGLSPTSLGLDVTETVLVEATDGEAESVDRLRDLGIRISLDDFGTGYSSLSYLKRLPADTLKVDRSFVGGLGENAADTAIVRTVIELAHTLGMEVVAEGVETEGQATLLREMGCDMAQGYHFCGPLPPEEVTGFLAG